MLSGSAAAEQLKGASGISQDLVKAHQDSALLAFMFMEITGTLALVGLWKFHWSSTPVSWNEIEAVHGIGPTIAAMP